MRIGSSREFLKYLMILSIQLHLHYILTQWKHIKKHFVSFLIYFCCDMGGHTSLVYKTNIARGTTGPGYWVHNLRNRVQQKLFQMGFSQNQMALFALVVNLAIACITKWHYLHCFKICSSGGAICIGSNVGHQVAPLVQVIQVVPLAFPNWLGLPYRYHQLELSLYLHY